MAQRSSALAWLTISAIAIVLVGWNVSELLDAFGSGPPYFGRTTNMDKWSDPLPALLLVNVLALVTILVASREIAFTP